MERLAFEKHYRVRELAGLWGLSAKTVTRLFADETGVIRVANDATRKRKYATLSIPESVASRVHLRLTRQPLEEMFSGGSHPIRIIRLSDVHAGTPRKPRNIVKVNVIGAIKGSHFRRDSRAPAVFKGAPRDTTAPAAEG